MAVRKKASQPGAARGRFRKGGSPKTTEITLKVRKAEPETSESGPTGREPTDSQTAGSESSDLFIEEPDQPLDVEAGYITVPDALVHELRLRSTERQDAGIEPWSLRDIVTEALRDWLSKPKNK